MLVKPAKGLSIRDPDLQDLLPAEGRDVPRNAYWLRRLADEDVREVRPRAKRAADAPEDDAAEDEIDAAPAAEPVEKDPA